MGEGLVLVDSSIWIEGIDPRVPAELKADLTALIEARRAAVTEMVRLEVIGGTRSASEFENARSEFEVFPCVKATEREWKKAEEITFTLNRKGQRVPSADILIAAVAVCHRIPLWHADKDFERVKKWVQGLDTVWYPRRRPSL